MNIKVDYKEVVPFETFELGWRFDNIHCPRISDTEKEQIIPLSEIESKRLNKVIDYYEYESNRIDKYFQTDWFSANSETENKVKNFKSFLEKQLERFDEDLIISWKRNLVLKITKKIFIEYWNDFLYPISDDVTVISEDVNWILFYNHVEVANIWIKK